MANVATCTRCGELYEAGSEEQANAVDAAGRPDRRCPSCSATCPPECQRGDAHEHPAQCSRIDETEYLEAGWGCCRCTVYNGVARARCRSCGHARCDGAG